MITEKNKWVIGGGGFLILLIVLLVVFLPGKEGSKSGSLEWPEITPENKPATYWWWMGNAVDKKNLKKQLETYYQAGLGGTKLIPIYGAKGYEEQFIEYLSPEWMDMLAFTAQVSDSLEMTLDLGAGTGWNMGGPWVRFEDAAKQVVIDTFALSGGQKLGEPIQHIQQPATNLKVQPKQPIAANPELHKKELYGIRYKRDLPLLSLMAYPEEGKVLDLTDKVGENGKLKWTAPSGKWKLYAVFLGTGGKTVERAAPGGVGWQIDYLSQEPVIRHMKQFEKAFANAGYEMDELIRAFHDDSFEQFTNWTKDLFREFKELQGYDLQNHLPALLGEGPTEKIKRVKNDYRETVSHLIIHEHTESWRDWARERGVKTINQAPQGAPAHPLDHWAVADQPDNTGPFPRQLYSKVASSAAHVTGKEIISQETATIMHGHFQNSLADIKHEEIDKIFLNGVNKIYYHSTTFSPEEAKWPGWLYYAPVHFVPANTIWKDFPKLNSYVARVSSFLRAGNPDNDILLYYPIYDVWHQKEGLPVPFRKIPEKLNTTQERLRENGYTFDYISDRQIINTTFRDEKLITNGGNDYQSLMLPPVQYIPIETLQHLLDLAENGATIVFSEGLPKHVPGFEKLEERQNKFQKLIQRLKNFRNSGNIPGKILLDQDEAGSILPEEANIPREPMVDEGLRFVRRSYEGGRHYFIKNASGHEINQFVPIATNAESVGIFDPLKETAGMAAVRKDDRARTGVYLQLNPDETCILRTFNQKAEGRKWEYLEQMESGQYIEDWKVSFLEGGPVIPSGFSTVQPAPWTQKGGKEARWFAGTAEYSTTFQASEEANAWIIDLGEVYHSARVEVNGQHLSTLIAPPYKVNISEALRQGANDLTVKVTNLAANRIRYMEQKGIDRPHFYNIGLSFDDYGDLPPASEWPVMESGLAGPVQLIPVKNKAVGVK